MQRKQYPLRIDPEVWAAVQRWADDDFRSVNGQIVYLLTECVKRRKKQGSQEDKDD